jgi:cytochrome c oxidase subunit 1
LLSPVFGGFDTGWTAYPPLATQTPLAGLLFELAFLTFGISSILGGMNFIATIITQRAQGMTWGRLPIFVWAVLAASVISLTATQWIAYGLLMIIFERIFQYGVLLASWRKRTAVRTRFLVLLVPGGLHHDPAGIRS